ncbi:hypothetical protein Pcinc_036162 [Petrolisthes cinctipes]|uniref:Uncharacterized protein n=1 Tax=Petrolisthes cinctipes TaxID=88211 RepID=A0AAE1EM94_PETCI|nr:hypothetical protein Pcinc_036162 [Petrolisthes cinctipes]
MIRQCKRRTGRDRHSEEEDEGTRLSVSHPYTLSPEELNYLARTEFAVRDSGFDSPPGRTKWLGMTFDLRGVCGGATTTSHSLSHPQLLHLHLAPPPVPQLLRFLSFFTSSNTGIQLTLSINFTSTQTTKHSYLQLHLQHLKTTSFLYLIPSYLYSLVFFPLPLPSLALAPVLPSTGFPPGFVRPPPGHQAGVRLGGREVGRKGCWMWLNGAGWLASTEG